MEDLPIVLVIEDDELIQSIVVNALTEGGFEPVIASSGDTRPHGRPVFFGFKSGDGLKVDAWTAHLY